MIQDYIKGKLTEQVTFLNALLDFQNIHLSQLATLMNAGKKGSLKRQQFSVQHL